MGNNINREEHSTMENNINKIVSKGYVAPPTLTPEQRAEFKARAAAERQAKIDAAIKKGARVQRVSVPISGDEQETIMTRSPTGETVIDTTISKDINKCLRAGYPIKDITYYEDRVVGLRCEFVKRGVVSM